MTNCFSKIALVIIRETKTKTKLRDSETSTNLAAILKTESRHCCNHLAVIIARENEVLDQSARAIFDNHHCDFTKYVYLKYSYSLRSIFLVKLQFILDLFSSLLASY